MGRVLGLETAVEDLEPDDFRRLRADITATRGPSSTANEIVRVKSLFKFAFEDGLIPKPVLYGQGFKIPSAKLIRKARNANGERMFEAAELRAIIKAAGPQLKAMILIAANGGMGNKDIGLLPLKVAVDFENGWMSFAREKTGAPRRFPLWPETVQAIRDYLPLRYKPLPEAAALLFVTRKGHCWSKKNAAGTLSTAFSNLLEELGMHRPGVGFYSIRRGFQTIGEEAGEVACKFIMGHIADPGDMSAVYRQRFSDDRLKAVTDRVHAWLFPPVKAEETQPENNS